MALIFKLFGNNSAKFAAPIFTNSLKNCSNNAGAGSTFLHYGMFLEFLYHYHSLIFPIFLTH